MKKTFLITKKWTNGFTESEFKIEEGFIELETDIKASVVYAQVMQDGSGTLWVNPKSISLTRKEAENKTLPSNYSTGSWGVFEFNFEKLNEQEKL